jgi:hypothetical protein
MTTITPVEFEILSQSTEDLTGLWEFAWYFQSHSHELSAAAALELARDGVRSLLNKGLIELHSREVEAQSSRLVPEEKVGVELARYANWTGQPTRGQLVWATATDLGMKLYFEGGLDVVPKDAG